MIVAGANSLKYFCREDPYLRDFAANAGRDLLLYILLIARNLPTSEALLINRHVCSVCVFVLALGAIELLDYFYTTYSSDDVVRRALKVK